jgi:hypothetical protein
LFFIAAVIATIDEQWASGFGSLMEAPGGVEPPTNGLGKGRGTTMLGCFQFLAVVPVCINL